MTSGTPPCARGLRSQLWVWFTRANCLETVHQWNETHKSGVTGWVKNSYRKKLARGSCGKVPRQNTSNITRSFGVEFEFTNGSHPLKSQQRSARSHCAVGTTTTGPSATGRSSPTLPSWAAPRRVSPILTGEAGITRCGRLWTQQAIIPASTHPAVPLPRRRSRLLPNDLKNPVKLWLQSEDAIDAVLAPSRRGRASGGATAMNVNGNSSKSVATKKTSAGSVL